jgi:hypothetical protein
MPRFRPPIKKQAAGFSGDLFQEVRADVDEALLQQGGPK